MRKFILFSFLYIFLGNFLVVPQTFQATIQQNINGTFPGSTLDVSLFLEHTGITSPVLGDCSFYINFNDPALGAPTLQSDGEWDGNSHSGYDNNIISVGSGVVSIEVITSGTPTFQIPNSPTLIGIIRFPIDDNNQNSLVSWNNSFTEVFDVSNNSIKGNGTFVNPGAFALPVELSSFTASLTQNVVNLKWETKTEVNNYGFEIERSSLNPQSAVRKAQFEKVGFVEGSGNSNSPRNYSFIDKNPSGGSKFVYRLKQIDNDGKFTYSDEVELEFVPAKFDLFQNYPNPFNPSTNIKFAVPKAGNITLSVYSILGEKVKDLISGFYEPGIYNIEFNAKELGSGTYIYRLQGENFVQVKKMLLIK